MDAIVRLDPGTTGSGLYEIRTGTVTTQTIFATFTDYDEAFRCAAARARICRDYLLDNVNDIAFRTDGTRF